MRKFSIASLVLSATLSILFSSSAFAYGGLISNGNFESGHTSWSEMESWNGTWNTSVQLINNYSWMSGNWLGSLIVYGAADANDALISSYFNLPNSANNVTVTFDSTQGSIFGSCWTGSNGLGVVLWDHTANESLDSKTVYNATSTNNQWKNISNTYSFGSSLSSRAGHQYDVTFKTVTNDTNCSHYYDIDNVNVNPGSAVYRLANWKTKERLFTTDWNEAQTIKDKNGWVHEGTSFYAENSGTAVYRLANWKTKERLFTTDRNEVQSINGVNGWVYENLSFYAY